MFGQATNNGQQPDLNNLMQMAQQMFTGNQEITTQGKPDLNEEDAVQEAIRLSLQEEPKKKS